MKLHLVKQSAESEMEERRQDGKMPGGETGSPLLFQCVMRRRTGTRAYSVLLVRLMVANNSLSTNRKSVFLCLFLATSGVFLKEILCFWPTYEYITIISVGISLKCFCGKLLKCECSNTVSNAGKSRYVYHDQEKLCSASSFTKTLHYSTLNFTRVGRSTVFP